MSKGKFYWYYYYFYKEKDKDVNEEDEEGIFREEDGYWNVECKLCYYYRYYDNVNIVE